MADVLSGRGSQNKYACGRVGVSICALRNPYPLGEKPEAPTFGLYSFGPFEAECDLLHYAVGRGRDMHRGVKATQGRFLVALKAQEQSLHHVLWEKPSRSQ